MTKPLKTLISQLFQALYVAIKKVLSTFVLATLLATGFSNNAQAKSLTDALPLLVVPTVIIAGKLAYDNVVNQKEEEAMLKAEEQRRIADEQRRLAENETQRKQDEYDRWFARLPREQQVAMVQQQEQARQVREKQAGTLFENVLPIVGDILN